MPRLVSRPSGAALAATAVLGTTALAAPAWAQEAEPAASPPSASAAFAAERWHAAGEPLAVRVQGLAPDARVAVFVGRTDVTALTRRQGDEVVYRPAQAGLPAGETEVSVHAISPDGTWEELGRFPVRILDRAGFRELGAAPALELMTDGDLDVGQELTVNFGFEGTAARPGWTVRSRATAVGVTREEQRLRFGERGLDAPAVDLSDYLVELESGPVTAGVGHVGFGESRHLISGFASRGVRGGVGIGRAARLSLAAMNGSSVVGWSNPLGLSRSDHRMLAGNVSVELAPASPGRAHVSATVLDGSLLPQAGYNQGVVNDAETGRGFGLEIAASDPSQRATVRAGFTRATFSNPADPLLAQGDELVPVRPVTRNARFLEASVQLLRAVTLGTAPASLPAGFRHERADPLYRSIAAFTQADVRRNVFEATAAFGQLAVQYAHGRSRDNLDDIASILTTHTRDHALTMSLPVGAVFGASYDAWWWPALGAGYQAVHQRGGGIPDDGGFNESHIPDQQSRNYSITLGWQRGPWNLTWQHNASRQDNRQPGRETADFHARVHAVSLGIRPAATVQLSLDASEERQRSIEFDQEQRTRRIGLTGDWRIMRLSTLAANVALTRSDDEPRTQENESLELRLEASQGFDLYRLAGGATQGRIFLRYARSRVRLGGPVAGLVPAETVWSVTTGLSLRLF